mgnify:CR=1 FL=1
MKIIQSLDFGCESNCFVRRRAVHQADNRHSRSQLVTRSRCSFRDTCVCQSYGYGLVPCCSLAALVMAVQAPCHHGLDMRPRTFRDAGWLSLGACWWHLVHSPVSCRFFALGQSSPSWT